MRRRSRRKELLYLSKVIARPACRRNETLSYVAVTLHPTLSVCDISSWQELPAGLGALFLFGSVARDQARGTSDIDVFFDLARPQGFTLFDLVALQERMQEIVGAKVDLMTRKGIHPRRRPRIEAAAIQV